MIDGNPKCSTWFIACVISLAVLAVGISLLDCFVLNPSPPRFDERYYYRVAEGISRGTYDDGNLVRPPLYPLFLGGVFRLFGTGLTPALIIQSFIRGLVIVMVALMGRRYVSEPGAAIGAAILVIYPDLVQIYARLMTEVLHVPLFLISFYLMEKAIRSESAADGAKAGFACGVASLARSISVFLTLIAAVWMIVSTCGSGRFTRKKLTVALLILLLLLVTVSPWTVRNAVVHGGLILVSNDAALNMWLVASGRDIKDVVSEWNTLGTQSERQRAAYRFWVRAMREDPGFHLRRLASRLPKLVFPGWGMPVPTRPHLSAGVDVIGIYLRLNRMLQPVAHIFLLMGGLAGVLVCERCRSRRNLILLLFVFFLVVHGSTLARVRFILALNVLLAMYSGELVARLWSFRRLWAK